MTTGRSAAEAAADDAQPVDELAELDHASESTVPSAATVITILRDWSVDDGGVGTSSAGAAPTRPRARGANWPGEMRESGLGKTARARIVPALGSTWLSTKSSWPLSVQLVSSKRRASSGSACGPASASFPWAEAR